MSDDKDPTPPSAAPDGEGAGGGPTRPTFKVTRAPIPSGTQKPFNTSGIKSTRPPVSGEAPRRVAAAPAPAEAAGSGTVGVPMLLLDLVSAGVAIAFAVLLFKIFNS